MRLKGGVDIKHATLFIFETERAVSLSAAARFISGMVAVPKTGAPSVAATFLTNEWSL